MDINISTGYDQSLQVRKQSLTVDDSTIIDIDY